LEIYFSRALVLPAGRLTTLCNINPHLRILKEKEKQMLSGEDYQRMEVNLNKK